MPPPPEHAEPPSKKHRVIVTSAARNLSTHPSAADYAVTFDEPFVDVTAVTLLSAHFPLSAYQVSSRNNRVPFRLAADPPDTVRVAELAPGDYEPPQALADELAARLTAAVGGLPAFSAAYDARADAYAISSSAPFTLLFDGGLAAYGPQLQDSFGEVTAQGLVEVTRVAGDRTVSYAPRSAARILGFGPRDYSSTATGAASQPQFHIRSEFRRDLTHAQTAVLAIDSADVNSSTAAEFNRSFAVVGRDVHRWEPALHATKGYNPPVGKLSRMRIRVYDVHGAPYDTQNHDHRLEFLLTCAPRYQSRQNWTQRPID